MTAPLAAKTAPRLSVVVLCYRSGEAAREVVARIREALEAGGIADHELVLVGNYKEGSDDITPQVVRELQAADPRVVCSTVPKQGMMGWDMHSGMALASGEAIAVIDGDGQILPHDLVRTFAELQRSGADMVAVRRNTRGDGALRRTLSRIYNLLFGLLFPGLPVDDVNGKPKVLTRDAYSRMDLHADDWFADAEIVIQARRLGLRIAQVETDFLGLTGRRSFVSGKAVVEFIVNLLRYRWREWRGDDAAESAQRTSPPNRWTGER